MTEFHDFQEEGEKRRETLPQCLYPKERAEEEGREKRKEPKGIFIIIVIIVLGEKKDIEKKRKKIVISTFVSETPCNAENSR